MQNKLITVGLQTALELTGDRREFSQSILQHIFSAFVYFAQGFMGSERWCTIVLLQHQRRCTKCPATPFILLLTLV